MRDQGKRELHKQIYTSSLLHQELHPVPRNHWVIHYAILNQITHVTHQSSDLEPLKKHTTFGKPHQEC